MDMTVLLLPVILRFEPADHITPQACGEVWLETRTNGHEDRNHDDDDDDDDAVSILVLL